MSSSGSLYSLIKKILKPMYTKFKRFTYRLVSFIIKIFVRVDGGGYILFDTFQGKYTCNSRAISEELFNRNSRLKQIWVTEKNFYQDSDWQDGIQLVKRYSLKHFYYLAKCKIIFDNAIQLYWVAYKKRKGQIVFNTFHGSMGLKRIDAAHHDNKEWVSGAKKLDSVIDYLISNSDFEDGVYRDYWKTPEILKFGHPRNDILFQYDKWQDVKNKVYNFFDLDKNVKLALYAPTFREKQETFYNLEYKSVCSALENKFGGKWILLVRLHFKTLINNAHTDLADNVLDASLYPDIQELIIASKIGITDYSSWICDMVLTTKPGFLFTPDLEKYTEERGFYYPLTETPFPICMDTKELCAAIEHFDADLYEVNRQKFLTDRGCCETGTASKKVVDLLENLSK